MFLPDREAQAAAEEAAYYAQPREICRACAGTGRLEAECCNGAGGCSCRGGIVDTGACRACGGMGEVYPGQQRPRANADHLYATGAAFLGSGPRSGSMWDGAIRLGYEGRGQ